MKLVFLLLATTFLTPIALQAQVAIHINEIMFAPVSPEPEWIELLNTASDTLDLAGWHIGIGTNARVTVDTLNSRVAPDSLVILTKSVSSLAALDSIPSSRIIHVNLPALNNSGSTVALYDASGGFVDSVSYNGNWIKHTGVSIERIDPSRPGYLASNWSYCRDPRGSTILRPNSVRKRNYDLMLTGIEANAESIILTIANVGRDSSQGTSIGVLFGSIDTIIVPVSGALAPDSAIPVPIPLPLNLFGKFDGIAYSIDALDANHSNDSLSFGVEFPIPPDSLILNEIMFDPTPSSCQWLELYNRSASYISLDSTRIVTGETRPAVYSRRVTPLLIAPDSFAIVAADSALFFQTYPQLRHRSGVSGLGTSTLELGRDSCFLVLQNIDSTTIDSVQYKKTWQQSLLTKTFVGISLERKDPNGSSVNPDNWQASIDSATPLAPSSASAPPPQDSIPPAGTAFATHFNPTTFSPNDGIQPTTSLTVQTGNASSVWELRVRIYDMRGRMVRLLTDATPITGATLLTFDGKRDNGQTLPPGVYAALIELTSSSPLRTLTQTAGVVIAGKRR